MEEKEFYSDDSYNSVDDDLDDAKFYEFLEEYLKQKKNTPIKKKSNKKTIKVPIKKKEKGLKEKKDKKEIKVKIKEVEKDEKPITSDVPGREIQGSPIPPIYIC